MLKKKQKPTTTQNITHAVLHFDLVSYTESEFF